MTGLPILHAIRHYYGGIASGFCGVALFLSCFFFTLGNITGTGAGMNLIFGFDWRIGSLIMLAILAFCYLTKGVYSKVEKGIMICICGMIIAFFATLIATGGPNWGQVGHGLTHPTLPEGSLATALAYISTNAAVTAGIYGTYLGLEKKWNKQDLFNGTMVADAITHIVTVVLISGSIVLVGAIVLHPDGIAIKAPAQLGDLLRPFLGNAAPIVMGVAIIGAGFSSLLGNTQRGVVLLNAGINKEIGLESKPVKILCIGCLAVATIICFAYGGSPTADLHRECCDVDRNTGRRPLHGPHALEEGTLYGHQGSACPAGIHDDLLYLRFIHDSDRTEDTDPESDPLLYGLIIGKEHPS